MPAIPARNSTLTPDGELTLADLHFDPPQLPDHQLEALASDLYGITGKFERLPGERDQNARILTADGREFVLKISGANEDPAVVDLQVQALLHIEKVDPGLAVPRLVRGRDDRAVYRARGPTSEHAVRLLTWLPGIRYQDGPAPSLAGVRGIGRFQARLCRALETFSHPAAAHFMPWDIGNGLVFRPQMQSMLPREVREFVAPALHRLRHDIYPRFPGLRSQVIHHDGHGANLLRFSPASEEVAGVIDFGDMIHGPLIFELTVSGVDVVEMEDAPGAALCALVEGFHSLVPLRIEEADLLVDLIIARLVLTLALFEFRHRYMENPPDFVIADQPVIIHNLRKLVELDHEALKQRLRGCVR